MTYFLLVYDRSRGQLIRPIEVFSQPERSSSMQRCFALEREYLGQKDIEIVVLGAESEEAIRKTHGRYFKTVELLGDLADAVAAS